MNAKTFHVGAKVSQESFAIIDQAAVIRGWPRSRVVEEGAILRAQQIVEQATQAQANARRAMRSAKARLGGFAKAAKRRDRSR